MDDMKKFLSIVAAVGLSAATATSVIACATESFGGDAISLADDHKSGSLELDYKAAERLNLCVKERNGTYKRGMSFVTSLDAENKAGGAVITATLADPDTTTGSIDVTLTSDKPMTKAAKVVFKFDRKTLEIRKLNLDWNGASKAHSLQKNKDSELKQKLTKVKE